jgi:hypothetical protein
MDNPEYTATQINQQLAKCSSRGITVAWDGGIIDSECVPGFDVYVGDADTPFLVIDQDSSFDVQQQTGPRSYSVLGWASGYHKIARLIAEVVEEAIADGTVTVEEEDAQ